MSEGRERDRERERERERLRRMTLGLSPEMYFVALAVAAIAAVPGYGLAAKALALVLVLILHVNWPMAQALWVYRHIPTARTPLPFVGNLLDIIGTKGQIHVKYREWQKEHGPVFKVFLGLSPAIVACELDLCREITLRRAQCFNIRPTPGPKGQAALSKEQQHQNQTGIFNTQNARLWKGLRSNANSIFHSADHLASFSPLMKVTALELADKLSKVPEGKPVDIWRCFGDMTLDVVGSTVFGVRFRSVESEEGAEAVKACRTIFKHNLLSPLVNPYVQIASLAPGFLVPAVAWCAERWPTAAMKELEWAGDILRRVTVEVYDYAAGEVQGEGERAEKEESASAPAGEKDGKVDGTKPKLEFLGTSFLKSFIEATNRDTGDKLTKEEVLPQAFIFLLAGYETTANTLGSTIYSLTQNKACEQKLIDEIDTLRKKQQDPDDLPGYAELKEYHYLNGVLQEVLRLSGPAPLFARKCSKTVDLAWQGGRVGTVHEGTAVHIASHCLHTSPKYWPDPERFQPERFVPGSEIYDLQNRKAHMAFGQGPRMCVAADFALTEAKLALITLYRRFRFDHNPEHEMKTRITVTLGPTNGIEVLVRRRA